MMGMVVLLTAAEGLAAFVARAAGEEGDDVFGVVEEQEPEILAEFPPMA